MPILPPSSGNLVKTVKELATAESLSGPTPGNILQAVDDLVIALGITPSQNITETVEALVIASNTPASPCFGTFTLDEDAKTATIDVDCIEGAIEDGDQLGIYVTGNNGDAFLITEIWSFFTVNVFNMTVQFGITVETLAALFPSVAGEPYVSGILVRTLSDASASNVVGVATRV